MDDKILFFRNKIYDGIYGYVIGDVLGVPIKNTNRSKLRLSPVNDMTGYGYYGVPSGTWSDNTSLMLATIDSIIEYNDINYDDLIFKMLNFSYYNNFKSNVDIFKLSNANTNSIINYKNGKLPINCGSISDIDSSCLSRIVPIIYYFYYGDYKFFEEVSIINDICSISHMNDTSKLGCMIFTDYTLQLLNGFSKFEALNFIKNREYDKYYSSDCINLYSRILKFDISDLKMYEIDSGDNIINTLEACLWSFLNGSNYKECLVKAVNLGNNTNTIGAITGLWCGILFGNQYVPKKWYNKLKGKDILNSICINFNAILEERSNVKRR